MPLSDEEQKILKEIEAQLNATDPGLVEQVSRTTLYRHAARMIRWAALGVLAGLVLLILTFADYTRRRAGRLPHHARLPARDRAQRAQARAGRARRPSPAAGGPAAGCAASSASRVAPGATASAATTPEPRVGYTAAQAARLAGCTVSQLRYWARSGLVPPTADGGGYSFRDLVALRVVRSLLDAGLSSTRVHAAVRWVRESGDDLASLRIVTDGRSVWACHDDGQILDALRAGPARAVRRGRPARRRRRRRRARVRRRARRVRRATHRLGYLRRPLASGRGPASRSDAAPPRRSARRCAAIAARIVSTCSHATSPRPATAARARTSPRSAGARAPSARARRRPRRARARGAARTPTRWPTVAAGRPATRSWSSASAHAPSTRRRGSWSSPAPARRGARARTTRSPKNPSTPSATAPTAITTAVTTLRTPWCAGGVGVGGLHLHRAAGDRRERRRDAGRGRACSPWSAVVPGVGDRRLRLRARRCRCRGSAPRTRASARTGSSPRRRSRPRARRARCGSSRGTGRRRSSVPGW